MTNFFSKSVRVAVFSIGGIVASTAAMADAGKCNGLSGYYGASTAIVVSNDRAANGDWKVGVVMVNGQRPNAYGTCSGAQMTIDFTDDHVINGTHDGTTISWNNSTTWSKQ